MIHIFIHVALLGLICLSYGVQAANLERMKSEIERDLYKKNMELHRDVRDLNSRLLEAEQLIQEHRRIRMFRI